MKRDYWDNISYNYESEIFDVLSNDRKKIILKQIRKHGGPRKIASDIGCGTGRFLPALSGSFQKVIAVDISPKLIRRAQRENSEIKNISYVRKDLALSNARLPSVDFALSVNAFLDPSVMRRRRMFDNVIRHLKKGASFLIVVPSIESALLTDMRLIEWNLSRGMTAKAALRAGSDSRNRIKNASLHQGNVLIDGISTKHYLREEMLVLMEKRGMAVIKTEKIEYPWTIEFDAPPKWMNDPLPWDWLFVAQKEA